MTPPAITLEKEGADKTSLVRMLSSALERKLTGRMSDYDLCRYHYADMPWAYL